MTFQLLCFSSCLLIWISIFPEKSFNGRLQFKTICSQFSLLKCSLLVLFLFFPLLSVFQALPPCWVWVSLPPTPPSLRSSPPSAWLASWVTTRCGGSHPPCTPLSCLSPTPSQVSCVRHDKCDELTFFNDFARMHHSEQEVCGHTINLYNDKTH